MKSMSAVVGAAMLVLVAGTANAGSNWMGFNAGAGIPTGDYSNAANTGWNLGVTGTHMIDSQWGIGADVGYLAWGASNDMNNVAEAVFGPSSEFNWSAVQATAHGVMQFPTQGNVHPYAQVGAGLYSMDLKLNSPSGDVSTSKSKLGFNIGGGMNFPASNNMKWGVSAAYHIVPTGSDYGSDVNFLSVGLNLMWGVGK